MFNNIIYSLYRFNSSMRRITTGRVTMLGVYLLFSFPLIFIIALSYYRLSTFYLFIVLFLVVMVSMLLSFCRRAKCEIRRELPSQALAGQDMVYHARLSNLSKRKLHSALLHDATPDRRPSREEFIHAKEPGEELRNSFDRLFKYYRWMWLIKRKSTFTSRPTILPIIGPGETKSVQLSCTPLKRGKIEFTHTHLLLPDPFGVFQKILPLAPDSASVTVLPMRYKLPELILEGASRNELGGKSTSNATGQTDEMIGLREYRTGDPQKHIHWKSWGKTGKPIVKEFENIFFPRYGLVLDTACDYEKDIDFEHAVSIAASFVCSVETKECLLDLIFLNQGAKVQTVGTGVAKSEEMLELLASVEIDPLPDWKNLAFMVNKHADNLSACIVIFVKLCPEREALIQQWKNAGINLLILVLLDPRLDESSELQQRIEKLEAIPISSTDIQVDLLNKLSGLTEKLK